MSVESRVERVVARGVRRGPYRKHSLDSKLAIVQQCLAPGASVAGIALANGVNANLLRKWIRHYQAGDYGGPAPVPQATLVPVRVCDRLDGAVKPWPAVTKGHIDIELPAGRVRVHGTVDAEMLRTVLMSLLQ